MDRSHIYLRDLKHVFVSTAPIGVLAMIVNLILTNGMAVALKTGFISQKFLGDQIDKILFSFNGFNGNAEILLMISVIFFPIVLAWKMFSFVNSKKASDVYFSIGISRKFLFSNRMIVSGVMIFCSVVIPFIVSVVWNVIVFGYSTVLFEATFFLIVRFVATSFSAFFLAVLVISTVGTRAEELTFIPALVVIPTAVVYFLDMIRRLFFYGFTFGGGDYITGNNTLIRAKESFFLTANKFNIFPVFDREMVSCQMNNFSSGYDLPKVNYLSLVVLILIAVALLFLANRAFLKIKPEKVGFKGSSPSMNIAVTGTVAIVAVIVLSKLLFNGSTSGVFEKMGTTNRSLLFLATVVAVYLILMPILTRNKKVFVKTMWKLPAFVAVLSIPVLMVMLGGFGASGRVPEIGDVKCASISIPISAKGALPNFVDNVSPYIKLEGGQISPYAGFTSVKDISLIREIHKSMLELKKKSRNRTDTYIKKMVIFYQLKDGSTLERTYDYVGKGVAEKWLKIVDSDFLKSAYISAFADTEKMSDAEYSAYLAEKSGNFQGSVMELKNSMNGRKAEISNAMGAKTDIDLNLEQTDELRKAVAKDLGIVPLGQIFFSQNQTLGMISFTEEMCTGKTFVSKIFIVEEMKNTLEYLERFKFSSKQDNSTKPVSAIVFELKNFCSKISTGSYSFHGSYLFSELGFDDNNGIEKYLDVQHDCKNITVTDVSVLDKLQELSLKNQFTYNEGYVVLYRYADKTQRAEYISYDKMPDELKPV